MTALVIESATLHVSRIAYRVLRKVKCYVIRNTQYAIRNTQYVGFNFTAELSHTPKTGTLDDHGGVK